MVQGVRPPVHSPIRKKTRTWTLGYSKSQPLSRMKELPVSSYHVSLYSDKCYDTIRVLFSTLLRDLGLHIKCKVSSNLSLCNAKPLAFVRLRNKFTNELRGLQHEIEEINSQRERPASVDRFDVAAAPQTWSE